MKKPRGRPKGALAPDETKHVRMNFTLRPDVAKALREYSATGPMSHLINELIVKHFKLTWQDPQDR